MACRNRNYLNERCVPYVSQLSIPRDEGPARVVGAAELDALSLGAASGLAIDLTGAGRAELFHLRVNALAVR